MSCLTLCPPAAFNNLQQTGFIARTLHDETVEFLRLLEIAQAIKDTAAKSTKARKSKAKRPPVSAKDSQKLLAVEYAKNGLEPPKYVSQHSGSWSAHVTYARSLRPETLQALGATAGARAWDFVEAMLEVWAEPPELIKGIGSDDPDALDDVVPQESMDTFMSESKIYGVWNQGGNSYSVSPRVNHYDRTWARVHVCLCVCVCVCVCRRAGNRPGYSMLGRIDTWSSGFVR